VNRRHAHFVARHLQLDQLLVARAPDRHTDGRPFRAAQLADRLVGLPPLGLFPFDLGDDVTAAEPLLIRGRALEHREDGDVAVDHLNGDAEAVVAAFLALPHPRIILRAHEAGMRVEGPQHAGDGAVDEPVRLEVADVVFLDRLQRRREDLVLVRHAVLGQGAAAEEAANQGTDHDDEEGGGDGPVLAHIEENVHPCLDPV
jgi:hypothetical protein